MHVLLLGGIRPESSPRSIFLKAVTRYHRFCKVEGFEVDTTYVEVIIVFAIDSGI